MTGYDYWSATSTLSGKRGGVSSLAPLLQSYTGHRWRQNSGFKLPRTLPRGDTINLPCGFCNQTCEGVSLTGVSMLSIGLRQLVHELS